MKSKILLIAMSLFLVVGSIPNRADSTKIEPKLDANRMMLTVTVSSIYNHNFQVNLPITLDKPFRVETNNGSVVNIISGTVGSPVQGKYPLPLYVFEGSTAGNSSMKGTNSFQLELDKPLGEGVTASFVFMRTVKLSRMPY